MSDYQNLPPAYDLEKCAACPLLGKSTFVAGEGCTREGCVFVVGEAPGEQEDKLARPFVGRSGELVRGVLDALGVNEQVYITNVVKRRPVTEAGKNRKPTKEECYKCGSHLMSEVVGLRPAYVITLGAVPSEFFLGKHIPMNVVHGLTAPRESYSVKYTVMPTYHPSYVLRQGGIHSRIGDDWVRDLQEFFEKINA